MPRQLVLRRELVSPLHKHARRKGDPKFYCGLRKRLMPRCNTCQMTNANALLDSRSILGESMERGTRWTVHEFARLIDATMFRSEFNGRFLRHGEFFYPV
jgi:hypothetical protein